MSGKGLESLIPPKKDDQQSVTGDQDQNVLSELEKNIADSQEEHKHLNSFAGDTTLNQEESLRDNKKLVSDLTESIFQIEIEKITPNPYQPRHDFDEQGLQELAQSIREFGILQPLVVSKIEKETEHGTEVEYQIIVGERRLRAAKLAGLERVPAIIKKIDHNRNKLEIALIENVQRSDLNPLESAKAYARLQDEFNLTQREIATRVGKSRETIANTLRLLNLPFHIQEALIQRKINESQARALLAVSNVQKQDEMFQQLLSKKLSARKIRQDIAKPSADPQQRYWEERLEEKLGVPVKVIKHGNRGKIAIQFYSEEEWQAIVNKLLGDSDT